MMAIYLHRVLRSDPDRPLHAMNHFFSPWMLLVLLVVPVLAGVAIRAVAGRGKWHDGIDERRHGGTGEQRPLRVAAKRGDPAINDRIRGYPRSPFAIRRAVFRRADRSWPSPCSPRPSTGTRSGSRKDGRVMVVERHSTWEPTTKPYDTTWFGERVGLQLRRDLRLPGPVLPDVAAAGDGQDRRRRRWPSATCWSSKRPRRATARPRSTAVLRFVEQGGGLLLIGDHTNFERIGHHR